MSAFSVRRIAALAGLIALAACAGPRTPPKPEPKPPVLAVPVSKPPAIVNALAAGVSGGPDVATLDPGPRGWGAALGAFRLSCPALQRRTDASGLTRQGDWAATCRAATDWPDADAAGFFAAQFETVQVGDGALFATGYYEPEIAGCRTAGEGCATPLYRNPGDIIVADLGQWSDSLKGRKVQGRIADGKFVPYWDRAEIEDGVLAERGLELAYAADPIELFFLEIQGSGRLRLVDGTVMRVGYDGQNGRDYVGIGKLMRDRGLLQPGQTSMQGIMGWLRANPEPGRAIMRENKSYVFFRELKGAGPVGALGVAVTGGASVATDPAFVPLGAPVYLAARDRPEATGLWVAQDTGGAIKGANRVDTFWGAGEAARTTAGGMSAHGRAWLLLPKGTLARLTADDAPARP